MLKEEGGNIKRKRTEQQLRHLHDRPSNHYPENQPLRERIFETFAVGEIEVFNYGRVAILRQSFGGDVTDELERRTWPTMETPRSLMNHGRFCVMAVIAPGGKRGSGQNGGEDKKREWRSSGREDGRVERVCPRGSCRPIWKHIFRAVDDGELALFPAELTFTLVPSFSSPKWPSTISQKRLFLTAIAIWCSPSSLTSPRAISSPSSKCKPPSMNSPRRRTWSTTP